MVAYVPGPRVRPGLDLDTVLSGRGGAAAIQRLVTAPLPHGLASALAACMPPDLRPSRCRLLHTRFEPGRRLTACYLLGFPGWDAARQLVVTWAAGPADRPQQLGVTALEEEAARRGLSAPFVRLAADSDDGRVRLLVAPVDPAFPQLVRLHDPDHATSLVAAVSGGNGTSYQPETARYRPGEDHLVRLAATTVGRPDLIARVYRDDTGGRAVRVAELLQGLLAATVPGAHVARPVGYVAVDRVGLWEDTPGRPLWRWFRADSAPPARLLRTFGRALRVVHDRGADHLALATLPQHDVEAEIATTLRAAEHIEVLNPTAAGRLRDVATRVARLVHRLPRERPTVGLRDLGCDDLLVHGDEICLLSVDRAAFTDPALDVAAFLADLRWWCRMRAAEAGPVAAAFLDGYGHGAPQRVARARALGALFDVALAARRVPLHDLHWHRHVESSVRVAEEVVGSLDRP